MPTKRQLGVGHAHLKPDKQKLRSYGRLFSSNRAYASEHHMRTGRYPHDGAPSDYKKRYHRALAGAGASTGLLAAGIAAHATHHDRAATGLMLGSIGASSYSLYQSHKRDKAMRKHTGTKRAAWYGFHNVAEGHTDRTFQRR